jgi:pentapeptide MXKDX repeat protein
MMSKNHIALIITASALVFGVAATPMAMAAESTDSTEHMTKPHTDAMKGDAMKGHPMKGDAMKGDAMKADSTKSEPPAQ